MIQYGINDNFAEIVDAFRSLMSDESIVFTGGGSPNTLSFGRFCENPGRFSQLYWELGGLWKILGDYISSCYYYNYDSRAMITDYWASVDSVKQIWFGAFLGARGPGAWVNG